MENLEENNTDEIILHFSLMECKENYEYSIEIKSIKDNSISFETEKKENESNNSTINFSRTLLCNYYFYKIQKIEVNIKRTKDSNFFVKYQLEPSYRLTLSTIINSKNSTFQYPINKNNENSEIIKIMAEKSNNIKQNKYTLFDYIKAGISFDSYIVIDFSDQSEHTHAMEINNYIKSIGGIREILYDFLKTFEVYGYGAKLKIPDKNNNNSSFFNLNLNGNKFLKGLTEIRRAYEQYLDELDFCNNNVLSPLIKNILRRIYEKYELTKYNILFLLMNKAPKKEDYQNCVDVLIESSFQPLSIVIIGIGDNENDFKNIQNLYNNKRSHSYGMERRKNNIFFVSMKECKNDANLLKNLCLKEVPKQMVEFYKIINTTPNDIRNNNLNNIKNSLNILDFGSLCENVDSAPSILSSSKYINNEKNELNIYDSNNLIEKNLQKQNVIDNEKFTVGKVELEEIDNDNFNDNKNNKINNENVNEIKEEDYNNCLNPKKKIIKKPKKHDEEKFINNLENRSKLVEKKDDNQKYTNIPLGEGECNKKENPYAPKFINTPKGSGGINQNNSKNEENPYKSSSISEESTLNSIKQSNNALAYKLNESENKINQNNNIKDSQQYRPFNNYSVDDY